VARLRFDDDLRNVFRSDSPSFLALERLEQEFGGDEDELVLLLEGSPALSVTGLRLVDQLRSVLLHLRGVAGFSSMLDLPALAALASEAERLPPSLVASRLQQDPVAGGRFVAAEHALVLVVVRLSAEERDVVRTARAVAAIETRSRQLATPLGIAVTATGIPVLRSRILLSLAEDQVRFTLVGLLLGAAIGALVFRSAATLAAFAAGPLVAVALVLAAFGWAGVPLDVFTHVLPLLVLVVGATDSMHWLLAFRRARKAAASVEAAVREARAEVAAACWWTSATTALGFLSLLFADAPVVRRFGVAGGLAMILTWVAVRWATPAALRLFAARFPPVTALEERLSQGTAALATGAFRRPRAVIAIALLFLVGAAWGARRGADFQLTEYLPPADPAVRALGRLDAAFGGSATVSVVVRWRSQAVPDRLLEALWDFGAVVEEVTSARTTSLAVLGPEGTAVPLAAVDRYPALRAFLREDLRAARVTGLLPAAPARDTRDLVRKLESEVAMRAADYPELAVSVAGLAPEAARRSLELLPSMARSLAVAVLLILLVVALGLRDWRLAPAVVITNLLPLAALVYLLVLTGRPYQFTTLTLFTVALGLAVDDTLHALSALRRSRLEGNELQAALGIAYGRCGPALVLTTALLAAGFAAVATSPLPLVALFGCWLALAQLAALLADLVVLPALLAVSPLRRRSAVAQRGREPLLPPPSLD
jgi:predicted RND superfamily exporter protein